MDARRPKTQENGKAIAIARLPICPTCPLQEILATIVDGNFHDMTKYVQFSYQ